MADIIRLRQKDGRWASIPCLIGEPAVLTSSKSEFQMGTSYVTPPTGTWLPTPPSVPQGQFLWTKVTQKFNRGDPVAYAFPSYQARDGKGQVNTVCGVKADSVLNVPLQLKNIPGDTTHRTVTDAEKTAWSGKTGTVNGKTGTTITLTADDVKALPAAGGIMSGSIAMGGNKITGLGAPINDNDAVTKSWASSPVLWTNPTPDTDMDAKSFPVDFSAWTVVLVVAKTWYKDGAGAGVVSEIGLVDSGITSRLISHDGDGIWARDFAVTADQISFQTGMFGNKAPEPALGGLVPWKIYGLVRK